VPALGKLHKFDSDSFMFFDQLRHSRQQNFSVDIAA
jgi:hypothetical protein